MKLEIQKDEYDEAKELAQKYLVNVATSNNSSVARNAAQSLLPQTQLIHTLKNFSPVIH